MNQLCLLATSADHDALDKVRSKLPPVDGELLLGSCVIRLEDTSAVVASAASRCLELLVAVLCTEGLSAKPSLASAMSESRFDRQHFCSPPEL